MKYYFTISIFFLSLISCSTKKEAATSPFPQILTTYRMIDSFDKDFKDLKTHGVEAIAIGRRYSDEIGILETSRKYNIKLMSRLEVPQVEPDGIETYQGLDDANAQTKINKAGFVQETPESAVMIGGAYNGKAIDRFTFKFNPGSNKIILEAPIYHRDEVYGDYGHYFPGMINPEKVEIIVKEKDYDGRQHLSIFPANFTKMNEHHWELQFDLTDATGDLNDVVIAAYWILHASKNKFRNNPTAYSPATIEEMKRVTRDHISTWKQLNGGIYPEEIIALRLGDEEWHRAAHTSTSPAVSYPVWDYSETAVREYQKLNPNEEYPRGQNFAHIFGKKAYASWFYSFHKGKTKIIEAIREVLEEEGLGHIKLYRNITRGDVFSTQNDHDGTGLELLSNAFDIIHLDPYPVRKSGYTNDILIDMAYMAGFARRFNKPLIPWLQAHQYYPDGYFGLTHPTPDEIEKMVRQHLNFHPDGIMWLGYGPGEFNTFPELRPDSWEKAGEMHKLVKAQEDMEISPEIAVIRPYTVRALRDEDRTFPQDHFFTETIIKDLVLNKKLAFNAYEPLNLSAIDKQEISKYKLVFAELGIMKEENLKLFQNIKTKVVLFIEGCERTDLAQNITGIKGFSNSNSGSDLKITNTKDNQEITINALDEYLVDESVQVLAWLENKPAVWQKENMIFVSMRAGEGDYKFADFIWNLTGME